MRIGTDLGDESGAAEPELICPGVVVPDGAVPVGPGEEVVGLGVRVV